MARHAAAEKFPLKASACPQCGLSVVAHDLARHMARHVDTDNEARLFCEIFDRKGYRGNACPFCLTHDSIEKHKRDYACRNCGSLFGLSPDDSKWVLIERKFRAKR